MLKSVLEQRKTRLEAKRNALRDTALASTDVNEVRSINARIEDLNQDLADVVAEIEALDKEQRDNVPANAQLVNGQVKASFGEAQNEKRENDMYESMEYRTAFMNYVQKGTEIPDEFRAGSAISTADTATAIPLTIMREVINTVRKRYGNLYNKVRKLNVQGGVEFPIGALQASFKWINESTVSPRQKLSKLGKVSFNYYTAEIRIAQSFLSQIVTIADFEAKISEVIAIAYLQAMDEGIVKGDGDGKMLGILHDPRVTNYVAMTASDMGDWTAWRKKFFANLPLGYRNGEFIFATSTIETYLETMADANNNPIFRQATGLEMNSGDDRYPSGRFFGREVSVVEPEILPDYDTASNNDVIGIYWQPNEYAINENFGFTMRRYFDEETNEWVDKAIVVVDGKVLNPTGYWLIKKSTSA